MKATVFTVLKLFMKKKSSSRFDTNMNIWLQDMQIHNYPHLTA